MKYKLIIYGHLMKLFHKKSEYFNEIHITFNENIIKQKQKRKKLFKYFYQKYHD